MENQRKLITPFGTTMDRELPLNDYPRPQMMRDNWQNLNGLWEYAIEKEGEFKGYTGKILVPFSPEAPLSGVNHILQPDETIFYKRSFTYQKKIDQPTALLHFGAVDYACKIFLNGKLVAVHQGGYTPFTLNVSGYLLEGENSLEVSATDPTEYGNQGTGKQTLKRGGIWYTPQSGIWQTVWLEQTTANYIKRIRYTPDIDNQTIKLELSFSQRREGFIFVIIYNGTEFRHFSGGDDITIRLNQIFRLWSPEDPYLYKVKILTQSGEEIKSYFAMRKISIGKDGQGVSRIFLNNKPYFQVGLLDQGYWPDGLYTAPTDKAMEYDIKVMKEMGFNMLRKHIKVEPLRWYYHCDRLGMLVWQDMVSGSDPEGRRGLRGTIGKKCYEKVFHVKKIKISDRNANHDLYSRTDDEGREKYLKECKDTINLLYNSPCVVLWTAFNESWGQFDSLAVAKQIKEWDPTRLVDHASGWMDQGGGDVNSLHNYSKKPWIARFDKQDNRPIVLSEYGGLTFKCEDKYLFDPKKFCGYSTFKKAEKAEKFFIRLQKRLIKLKVKKGLCATVYTQVSDVEEELNGIMTYDRRVIKWNVKNIKNINRKLGGK